MTVGDVPVGQVGRATEGLLQDRHPVVGLVAIAQVLEDLDRVGDGRLVDLDGLEAPFEGGVLEVLRYSSSVVAPIVCNSPRASMGLRIEAASMAPSAGACTDERVQLVDEQDDVAPGLDLLEDLLEALLEVAPEAEPATSAPRSSV